MPPSGKHRADIDGLRAIAVLMVLVFHFDLLPFGRAGFIGVDVFFVISGFLITSIVNRQLDAGQFSLKNFYLSRIRRLAPALFVTLILVMITGLICLFPSDLLSLTNEIFAAQSYVANIYYWRTVNYFGLSVSSAFLLHTWSLAVEEQFYLIYPLCLLLAHRYFRRYLWPIIFIAMALSFCANLAFVSSKPQATFYLLPTRAWELLIGAMILPALSRIPGRRHYAEAAGLAGLAAIAIGFVTYDRSIYFPGWFALLPTLGAALALWFGTIANTITNRALSNGFWAMQAWFPTRSIRCTGRSPYSHPASSAANMGWYGERQWWYYHLARLHSCIISSNSLSGADGFSSRATG